MTMSTLKRIVSLFLVLGMLVGAVPPVEVRAGEAEQTQSAVTEGSAEESTSVETVPAETEPPATQTEETTVSTEAAEETAVTEAETAPTAEDIDQSASAEAGNEDAANVCGDNLTWELDEEGTLTISGTGEMYDYSLRAAPWDSFRKSIKSVVIEDGVTSIGEFAFNYCTNLAELSFAEGVTSIGKMRF